MAGFRGIPLLLAPLLPALMALAVALYVRRRRRVAGALGEPPLVRRLVGEDLNRVPWLRAALTLGAALALGLAAAEPSAPAAAAATAAGRDVVLVLDVSNSMRVEDVPPNRLERQREAAHRLLRALRNDRVGLVVFAGQASVLAPPTRDHGAVAMLIDAAHPEIALQTGSAIGGGLRQAAGLLAATADRPGGRVAVLISDGEPQGEAADAAFAAARRAAGLGVTVHTLGVGTARGGPVPDIDPRTGARTGYKRDPADGRIAISALDDALLRQIARETGGTYHHLDEPAVIDALLVQLGAGEPADRDAAPVGRVPRYIWLVVLALALIAADAVAALRRVVVRAA